MDLGIYVHIPFCKSKCHYCDFLSYSEDESRYSDYVDALVREIEAHGDDSHNVNTIFIGGGTPSVLPPIFLEKILTALDRNFNIHSEVEYTIEANPGTLTKDKLTVMKEYGVNRISIGAQSFNNGLLRKIGRGHSSYDIDSSVLMCRQLGFNNINLDIMFALPGQSLDILEESLKHITRLEPEHISAYGLIIEEGTYLADLYKSGELQEIDEELERSMYYLVKEYLTSQGYIQYEISNFSKEGMESIHNTNTWKYRPYIGVGLGAHSFYKNYRYSNTTNIKEYILSSSKLDNIQINKEHLNTCRQMEEYMFLGLRLNEGIDIRNFEKRFNKSIYQVYGREIDRHIQNKLLIKDRYNIRLTDYGQDVSNQVFCSFLLDY